MATTGKSPGVDSTRIAALIPEIKHYAQLNPDVVTEGQKNELLRAAKNLIANLQDPHETAWLLGSGAKVDAFLRTAYRMGLYRAWDESPDGTMTSAALADKLGADRTLIVRMLRVLITHGVFEEPEEEVYVHNRLSKTIGTSPMDGFMHGIMEIIADGIAKMPNYLETITHYRNPGELGTAVTMFQFTYDTKLNYFEWAKDHPEYRVQFEKAMDDLNAWYRFGEPTGLAAMYPFEQELGHDTGGDDVVLVDVGGGRGQVLVDIHKHLPNLKGRLVLEDLAATFTDFEAPPGIELMPHSFFDPQPIVGARAYIFRHIMHSFPDSDYKKILANTIATMVKGRSRILIVDQVLANVSSEGSTYGQFLDIQMVIVSGMERKESHWHALLYDVGLRIVKIWPEHKYDRVIEAVPVDW